MNEINHQVLRQYATQYRTELLEKVIPFWEKHSPDQQHGGYFTCLLRDGQVFDTDKFVWLQARQVWTFAKLYEQLDPRPEWLSLSKLGADFLEKHGRDERGDWYFSLTQVGQPLVQAYNIFSDCFAAMAFAQLAKVTRQERYADIAMQTFQRILHRQNDPKGRYEKSVPDTRPLRGFALPMILCNLALELEHLLEPTQVDELTERCINQVMQDFRDPDTGLILENIGTDGRILDTFDGRLLNPGHAIEAMWFIMDLAERRQDQVLVQQAVEIVLRTLRYAWDEEYGGLYYFMDRKGYPPQQLEWDQKLWWVHLETLVALAKAINHTRDATCFQWFERVHHYVWTHFPDPTYGEWYGYLNRRGEVLLPLKGGKWKGCFHVPRGLWQTSRALSSATFS